MHDFFLALGHLLWKSLTSTVGWMGTTVLALVVGIFRYYVEPRIEARLRGTKPAPRPNITGSIVAGLLIWLLLFSLNTVYTIYMDHTKLVLENQSLAREKTSNVAEVGSLRTENEHLAEQLRSLNEIEPPDSLRRRTFKLADEYYKYAMKRMERHPPAAYPDSSDPNPSEERKKPIQVSRSYDQETEEYYLKHFKDRMVGIIKEYDAKGVRTGYLEPGLVQRPPGVVLPGSAWEGSQMDELAQFRELAYHVDAKDRLIVLSD
jgi:hypothetical protein